MYIVGYNPKETLQTCKSNIESLKADVLRLSSRCGQSLAPHLTGNVKATEGQ